MELFWRPRDRPPFRGVLINYETPPIDPPLQYVGRTAKLFNGHSHQLFANNSQMLSRGESLGNVPNFTMAELEIPGNPTAGEHVGGKMAWKSGLQSSHPFAVFSADGGSIQCIPCSEAKTRVNVNNTTFTRTHCTSAAHQNEMR